MKKVSIIFLVFSVFFLSGCTLNNISNKNVDNQTEISPEPTSEEEGLVNSEWEEILNSEKLKQCLQSKKDLEAKKDELLPKYKEVLNKETNGTPLTTEDEYTKHLYSYFQGALSNLETQFSRNPGTEEGIIDAKTLLDYLYCPDVSKISLSYPLTSDSCYEILSTSSMNPVEYPLIRNYDLKEEYNLAVKRMKDQKTLIESNNYKCCYQGGIGTGCTKLIYYLQ